MTLGCTPLTFDSTAYRFDSTHLTWDQTEVCPPLKDFFPQDLVSLAYPRRKRKRLFNQLLLLG